MIRGNEEGIKIKVRGDYRAEVIIRLEGRSATVGILPVVPVVFDNDLDGVQGVVMPAVQVRPHPRDNVGGDVAILSAQVVPLQRRRGSDAGPAADNPTRADMSSGCRGRQGQAPSP